VDGGVGTTVLFTPQESRKRIKMHFNTFFGLPESLSVELFVDWLHVADLGRLEAACCNRSARQQLLKLFCNDRLVLKASDFLLSTDSRVRWFAKRKLKSVRATITGDRHPTALVDFFSSAGGNHLRSVHVRRVQQGATILPIISLTCKRLSAVCLIACGDIAGLDAVLKSSQQTICSIYIADCRLQLTHEYDWLQLPRLRRLCIDCRCEAGVTERLLSLGTCLEDVHIQHATLSAHCMELLCGSSTTLHRLHFESCPTLTDAMLRTLSSVCTGLTHLVVSDCGSGVTDEGVLAVIEHCPQLEAVLAGEVLSDRLLEAVARRCGPRLRHLGIMQHNDFNADAGFAAVALHCRNLESLTVSAAAAPPRAIERLIAAQTGLRELALMFGDTDDSVLQAAGGHAATLTYLNLYSATGYSTSALVDLAFKCTSLQVLCVDEENPLVPEIARDFWQRLRPYLVVELTEDNPPVWDTPSWTLD
jgi:hypothetical protein